MDAVLIGAALLVAEGGWARYWWKKRFRHPLSAGIGICAVGVAMVVAVWCGWAIQATEFTPILACTVLICYAVFGGAPILLWAFKRRDGDAFSALEAWARNATQER